MKVTVLLLAVLLPSPLLAQGLGDTAARERQKREEKQTAAPAKVFTDQDLAAPVIPSGLRVSPVPRDPQSRRTPRRPARTRLLGVTRHCRRPRPRSRTTLSRRSARSASSSRPSGASASRTPASSSRSRKPTPGSEVVRTEFYQGIPVQMRVKEQVETEELKQARKALADLTEEFRRTGFPPGWARE